MRDDPAGAFSTIALMRSPDAADSVKLSRALFVILVFDVVPPKAASRTVKLMEMPISSEVNSSRRLLLELAALHV